MTTLVLTRQSLHGVAELVLAGPQYRQSGTIRLRAVPGGFAPAGVRAPAQYRTRITAIILYLYLGQFLSKDRTAKALEELFGISVSGRTVLNMAERAAGALCEMKTLVDAALAAGGLEHLDQVALAKQVRLFKAAAVIGTNDTKARSSKLMKKFHALATRMTVRQGDYLRFTRDELVPFDNNAAEREIRMIKLRQKVSGCLRTLAGAEQFCAIRSYLATARKHGVHFFHALVQLAEGRPWLPETIQPLGQLAVAA
jgi:hypothetical protein